MDGLHVGKGKPSVVITALHLDETRGYHVLKVLEGDEHVRLRDYLNGLEPRQKPLPVVIDRSWTFKSAIEAARLPIALVLDRYHLARLGNLALGNARKELIGEDLEEDWEDRKQEIYNRAEASSGCQLRLDGMGTEKLDQMAAVYKATLWYQWILTADASREEATEMFREWKGALQTPIRKYFEGKVFGALEEPWRRGTLNYYDYPYTNGFNEGINNIGKELERIGAGYSNTTIQAKLRYSQSHTGLFDTGGSFKVWLDLFDARLSHADADTPFCWTRLSWSSLTLASARTQQRGARSSTRRRASGLVAGLGARSARLPDGNRLAGNFCAAAQLTHKGEVQPGEGSPPPRPLRSPNFKSYEHSVRPRLPFVQPAAS